MTHPKLGQTDGYPVELSLSKLHRVLRPLRSRALALENLLNSSAALLRSPSRRARGRKGPTASPLSSSNPPLKPSRSPKRSRRVRSLSVIPTSLEDYGPVPAMESPEPIYPFQLASASRRGVPVDSLSRKVTAVCDAFRAVVKVAYPNKYQSSSIVPSLSHMCAAVLGASIEPSVVALVSRDDGDSDDELEEESPEETEIVDQCYEDIPEHVRRWAIIPHAIGIIHRVLPGPVPNLWEDILTICIENCCRNDVNTVTLYLLSAALIPFPYNDHPLDPVLHEKYLIVLYVTISSTPRYRCSEDDFVNLVLKTMNSAAVEPVWSAMALDYLFKHMSDPFARLKLFDAIVASFQGNPRNLAQIRRWCSQIIEIDLALPPDDAFEDAPVWIDALRSTAICFLDILELEGTVDLFPGAISFATHVLARCDGWRVATLIAKMGRVSRPLTSEGPPHFRPLLLILDDSYLFESVRDYAQVLRQAGTLFDLEVLFLTNVVAHVEVHNEPTDEDPDPEPLLDDLELEAVSNWLAEAEDRLTQLREADERGSHAGTPKNQPTTPTPRRSPRKPQPNNGKRGAKSARVVDSARSPALRPAKRTRATSRLTSPPIEIPVSSVPSSPFRGAAHLHSKENRTIPLHSAHTTPSKARPLVYSKESKSERPVTPRAQRKSSRTRTSVLAGYPRSVKHPNVQDMEGDTSDSEKTASSEPDPLDLFATASRSHVRRLTRG